MTEVAHLLEIEYSRYGGNDKTKEQPTLTDAEAEDHDDCEPTAGKPMC